MKTSRSTQTLERVFLIGVGVKRPTHVPGHAAAEDAREFISELSELARSAGAVVAGTMLQMRDKIDPATVVGRGKIDEIRAEASAHNAQIVIFDRELSPVQQRNLERD